MTKKYLQQIEQIIEIASEEDLTFAMNKALTLALSTENNELVFWLECELCGYLEDNQAYMDNPIKVPEYRKVVGFYMDDHNIKLQQYYTDLHDFNFYYLREGVSELEKWKHKDTMICIQGTSAFKMLSEKFGVSITKFVYNSSTISGVLQDIRNKLIKELIKIKKSYNIEFSYLSKTDCEKFLQSLHPAVHTIALKYFEDEHYRSAILDTFIKLIELVKTKSGISNKDGCALIDATFSQNAPILKVSEDKDEQQGAMFLFKGAIMYVRNPHAHKIKEWEDPQQALEWLSFASVLFRLLENK